MSLMLPTVRIKVTFPFFTLSKLKEEFLIDFTAKETEDKTVVMEMTC